MNVKNETIIIFANGTHLQAVECVINGIKQWRWVAVGFEDDSFLNGKLINPFEYADEQSGLVENFDNDQF